MTKEEKQLNQILDIIRRDDSINVVRNFGRRLLRDGVIPKYKPNALGKLLAVKVLEIEGLESRYVKMAEKVKKGGIVSDNSIISLIYCLEKKYTKSK